MDKIVATNKIKVERQDLDQWRDNDIWATTRVYIT
jgi:hypothetical protein